MPVPPTSRLFVILLACGLALPLFGQWTSVNVGATDDLNTIDFEGNNIFLGGYEFVKSLDGGNSWEAYPLTDDLNATIFGSELYDIHFFDQNTGVATGFILTGNSEVILRTVNGGLNWSFVSVNNAGAWPRLLNAIDFPTATAGYAVGSNGRVLKSVNAGQNWTAVFSGTTKELHAVHFFSATAGIVAGDGVILKTVNGGASWSTFNFPGNTLYDLHFINGNVGVACGSGGLLKTVNGGNSWTPLTGNAGGNAVYMLGADTLFVGGPGLLESVNGGAYFLPQPSVPSTETIQDVAFRNGTVGYAVGDDGVVRRTTTFGDPFPLNDAGVLEIEPFPSNPCPDIFPVRVQVKNIGLHPLTQVALHWEVNGQAQTPYLWSGNLAPGQSSGFFTVGNYFFPLGNNAVKVWTAQPNGTTDDFPANDTLTAGFPLGRLSGTYTIGGAGAHFQTIGAAVNAMSYPGICDNVVFNIRNGVYAENITLSALQIAPDNYSVTFQSESGNPADVVLTTPTGGFTEYPTLKIDGARHITVRNITLKSNGVNLHRPLEITNGASDIQLLNNVLEGKQTIFTGNAFTVMYVHGPACKNLVFRNNTVRFGNFGLVLGATPAAPGADNVIENNTFQQQSLGGIACYLQRGVSVSGNTIAIFTNSIQNEATGIFLESCTDTFVVSRNIIGMTSGSGLQMRNCTTTGGLGRVYNNFVRMQDFWGSPEVYSRGIVVESSHNLDIFFNTVDVQNYNTYPSSSAAMVLYVTNPNVFYNLNVRNNLFSNSGEGLVYKIFHSIFSISVGKVFNTIDNNAYYFKGVIFAEADVSEAYYSGNLTSLAEWKIVVDKDFESFIVDPQFIGDLHIVPYTSNYRLNAAAVPIPGIDEDIDGEPRDPLRPDIGADEFAQPALDAGAGRIVNTVLYCAGSSPVAATVKNYGSDTIHAITVNWSVNNIPQTPYVWNGTLASGAESDTLQLGFFDFAGGASHGVSVWTSNPNNMPDPFTVNDGVVVSVQGGGLSGVYTIGGANADFPTFGAARAALVSQGVCSAVTFKVRPGVYNEQVSFPEIAGASAWNTITFESENGYNQSVLLTFAANSTANYTLRLDGADYFTFQNLSFTAANNTDYNTILYLKNRACHNRFIGNRFIGLDFPQNYNWHYPINSDYSLHEFNLFDGNAMENGTYTVWIKGDQNNTGPIIRYARGNRFVNNTITGAKHKSMLLEFQQDPVVEKNTIFLDIPVWAPYANGGIQLLYAIGQIRILSNRVVGKAEIGIQLYGVRSSLIERGLIANNFVGVTGSVVTALQLGQCSTLDIFSNNLLIHGATLNGGNALGMVYVPQDNIALANNNLVNRLQNGAALFAPESELIASDYNNFFTASNTLAVVAGAAYSDLAGLQAGSGFDLHSLNVDPLFVSDADLHLTAGSPVRGAGTPVSAVPADIDGEARHAATPDIGADEYSVRPVLTFENLAFVSPDAGGWSVPVACGNAVPAVLPCDSTGNGVFKLAANLHCSLDSCYAASVKWFVFDGMTLVAEGQAPLSWAAGPDVPLQFQLPYALFEPNKPYALTLEYDCGMCSPCACTIQFIAAACGGCECLAYTDFKFNVDGGAVHPAACNQTIPVELSCPTGAGLTFSFEGSLYCTNACGTAVEWEIRHTFFNTVLFSGSAPLNWQSGVSYHFQLPNLPFSKFQMPGAYNLYLKGHCGDAECACTVGFYLPVCDVCACPALQDMQFIADGDTLPAVCNNQNLVVLDCPETSGVFSFEGTVLCSDSCTAAVNYRILSFSDQQLWSGTAEMTPLGGNLYRFILSGIPYNILPTEAFNKLVLGAECSGKLCAYCTINFSMPPCDFCCIYPDDFAQAIEDATSVTVDNIACEATLHIGDLPNCGDYIAGVQWGDGAESPGPFISGVSLSHTYPASGDYILRYTAYELNAAGQTCLEKQFEQAVSVNCEPCDWPAFSTGLTGYFPFNGSADDLSPTNLDGVIQGAATLTSGHEGQTNSAYHFNGQNSLIECGGNNRGVTNAVTVCAWVKTTEQSKVQWVAGKFEGYYLSGGRGYRLAIGNEFGNNNIGRAGFGGTSASGLFSSSGYSSTLINDGQWHCLVGVAADQSWKIYVDGKLESSAPGGTSNLTSAASRPLSIGGFSPPIYPVWMNGDIDNVRLYNRALTDHEVECLCSDGFTTPSLDWTAGAAITLFPNPTDGNFSLLFEPTAAPADMVRIVDPYGRTVRTVLLPPGGVREYRLSITSLPAGLYLVNVLKEGELLWTHKLVKQ